MCKLLFGRLVRKTCRPDWDNAFANEKDTYKRLKPLQGRIMPHFVGSAEFDKLPSIVLSRLEGTPLCKQGPIALPAEDLEPQLEVILRAFTKFEVVYDDPKLDNLLVANGRVMMVDLESMCVRRLGRTWSLLLKPIANMLCRSIAGT